MKKKLVALMMAATIVGSMAGGVVAQAEETVKIGLVSMITGAARYFRTS